MSSASIDLTQDNENQSGFNCNDSDIYVIDETGSELTNPTTTEDEPEIIFVKETSRSSPFPSTELDSATETTGSLLPSTILEGVKETLNSFPSTELEISKDKSSPVKENNEPEIICLSPDGPSVKAGTLKITDGSITSVLEEEAGFFCLDTTPVSSETKSLGPRFRREFSTTLKFEEEVADSSDDVAKSDNRCFNCQGDHSMHSCPSPKNYVEISKNRAAFLKNVPKFTNRYHEDKAGKFDQFKPGVLSQELRDALGLRSSEIPLHIYQMRILGYPPGWLEEMKDNHSGLELIDSKSAVPSLEGNPGVTYDFDKLVDYPGFNVPLGARFRDEWRYLNFPPMQQHQSKEIFIEHLRRYCTPKVSFTTTENAHHFVSTSETNLECIDMDTSIEDLEEQRQLLLAKLQGEEVTLDDSDSDPKEIQTVNGENNDFKLYESQGPSTSSTVTESNHEDDLIHSNGGKSTNQQLPSTQTSDNRSPAQNQLDTAAKESKLLAMGTPVSIRFSPYNTLPTLDKFARNMGDLELFENLPTSTGAFQRMRSLLVKVRKAFNKKR